MDEIDLLARLGNLPAGFTAAQIARRGWAGFRTREAATDALDALASAGKLRRLPANRKGQATYAMPSEDGASGGRVYWSSWGDGDQASLGQMYDDFGDTMFSITYLPDDDFAAEIARLAKALESGDLPKLRAAADHVREEVRKTITYEALAWILAVAQDRIDPEFAPLPRGRKTGYSVEQNNDPISTHLRGIAQFIGIRYATMLEAVRVAETELKRCRDWEPTMLLGSGEKLRAA